MRREQEQDPYGWNDPAHWRAGWLDVYVNARDPRLWVRKRRGIGWTLNFAHARARVVLALLGGAVLATAVLPQLLRRP
jgi:uncharacterized membrane protein